MGRGGAEQAQRPLAATARACRAAEELYRKDLGIAREQEAKLWELRALGEPRPAVARPGPPRRELLTPVHSWFTEGFDTPDLKDARVMLNKLA